MELQHPPLAVQSFIDERKMSRFQIVTLLLCFAILLLDGYDTVVVGYIAPALKAQFGVAPPQLAPMFGAGLFGLTIGSFGFGPVADRFGRKATLILSTALFALVSLASAWSDSIHTLTILRFLTGLGLGGAMPNAYTLAAEYCPTRLRATLVAPIGCGIGAGGAVGGLIASPLIHAFGWPVMLIVGGVFPLLLIPVLMLYLPESARYLAARGDRESKVRAILHKIDVRADVANRAIAKPQVALKGSPIAGLLRPGIGGGTMLLWVTAFMTLLVIYFLGNWLPLLIQRGGVSFRDASLMTSIYLTGNTIGALILGYLMDRRNPQYVLAAAFIAAGLALVAFGHMEGAEWPAFLALFITGCGTGGTMTGTNILSAVYYPTGVRATGVAWTLGMGRVGSIVGSMIGGMMLSAHWDLPTIFGAVALPVVIAAISVSLLAVYRARHPETGTTPEPAAGEPLAH